jgi:hypothetical protein
MDNDALLTRLYKDPKLAINSVDKLYKAARAQGSYITRAEVKKWYDSRDVNQTRYYRTNNSWVANYAREEYQVDVAYMTFLDREYLGPYSYAFICIDVFSKRAWVVPVQSTSGENSAEAMKICFRRMGGSPSYVYCDKGPEFNNPQFKKVLEENGTSLMFTHKHAIFAERFIRTLKQYMIKKTQEAEDQHWYKLLSGFLSNYNNDERVNSTKLAPKEASNEENAAEVRINLLMKAKRQRKYPELKEGDQVRIYDKGGGKYDAQKITSTKWSKDKYSVSEVEGSLGMTHYRLEGKNDPYLRHELLKV